MQNELYIEEVLDSVVRDRLPESQAEFILREEQVSDPAKEISLHQAAATAVRRFAILAQVRAVHQEHLLAMDTAAMAEKKTAPVRRMGWKPWLRAAAVIVLVLSGWFTIQLASTSGESLYTELYQPFTINTERGQDDARKNDILDRFKAGDYLTVIRLYNQAADPDNREHFLAAYALQAKGDFRESIKPLRAILDQNQRSGSMLYQDEAEYYLGLALLQEKAYADAEQLFAKIYRETDHTYHSRVNAWMLTRLRWLR